MLCISFLTYDLLIILKFIMLIKSIPNIYIVIFILSLSILKLTNANSITIAANEKLDMNLFKLLFSLGNIIPRYIDKR